MKKLILLATASSFFYACQSDDPKTEDILKGKLSADLVENPRSAENMNASKLANLGHLQFEDTLHDFGTMKEGEMAEYEFNYSNTGKKAIIINEAKGSCGCTVPEYNSSPLQPGEKSKMKVTFNSQGKRGFNEKTVTITTNGNPSTYTLKILATVNN
jgi:uncharacterized cupredoxin-like copper-binding protein